VIAKSININNIYINLIKLFTFENIPGYFNKHRLSLHNLDYLNCTLKINIILRSF